MNNKYVLLILNDDKINLNSFVQAYFAYLLKLFFSLADFAVIWRIYFNHLEFGSNSFFLLIGSNF